ncbi:MAG: hypothetical protein ACP5NZ_04360 [Nanobdellota archaeon]
MINIKRNSEKEKMDLKTKALVVAVGGFALYFFTLTGVQELTTLSLFREKIKTQSELERVGKEEAERLGLGNYDVKYIYDDKETSMRKKRDTGKYELGMTKRLATRKNVKHELYHLLKDVEGEKNSKPNFVRYFFIQEPRATLYGTFGIKL